jgi:uncharacterized alkaline shock family protein YloU
MENSKSGMAAARGGMEPGKEPPLAKDRVEVSDEALATLIGLAAHEVPGVVGMAPANLRDGFKRILGHAQADAGVEVERPEDPKQALVILHVVVAYGVNIPAVAESIRERVKYAAHNYGGVEVEAVRVVVAGVSRG